MNKIGNISIKGKVILPLHIVFDERILSIDQYELQRCDSLGETYALEIKAYITEDIDPVYDWYLVINPRIPMRSTEFVYLEHYEDEQREVLAEPDVAIFDGVVPVTSFEDSVNFAFDLRVLTGWTDEMALEGFPADLENLFFEDYYLKTISHASLVFKPKPISDIRKTFLDAYCYRLFIQQLHEEPNIFGDFIASYEDKDALQAAMISTSHIKNPDVIDSIFDAIDSLDAQTHSNTRHEAALFNFLAKNIDINPIALFSHLQGRDTLEGIKAEIELLFTQTQS